MSILTETLSHASRMRGAANIIEDLGSFLSGKLDYKSFISGYKAGANPVEVVVRGADGKVKAIRRTHNLRTNSGGDLQAKQMSGDTSLGDSGTATATSATTLTDSGKAWTTNQWAGHVVFAASVYGVVLSNTATVLTVDKWYAPATPGGAAGTTPGNVAYVVALATNPGQWIAVSTDAGAPATTDTTLTAEQSTNGLARAFATFAHTAITGGTTTTVGGTLTLTKTFSVTGTTSGVQKSGIFNAANGGTMMFENTFSSVNVINGDSLQITWTISY